MKKRKFLTVLTSAVLAASLLLVGCGGSVGSSASAGASGESNVESAAETETVSPTANVQAETEDWAAEATDAETIQAQYTAAEEFRKATGKSDDELALDMSNSNLQPYYYYDGTWVYGMGRSDDKKSCFIKMKPDGSDTELLKYNVRPYEITINGDYVYAILYNYADSQQDENGSVSPELYRIKTDGTDGKTLASNVSDYQISGDKIYYTPVQTTYGEKGHYLYMCDLDGSNAQIALEKEVFYPTVAGDYMLYQEDEDKDSNGGERIAIYNFKTGESINLTNCRSFRPVLYGDKLIYLSTNLQRVDNKTAYSTKEMWICVKDLKTGETVRLLQNCSKFGIANGRIYYQDLTGNASLISAMDLDGKNSERISTHSFNYPNFYLYSDGIIYTSFRDDQYNTIKCVPMADLNGDNEVNLYKNMTVEAPETETQ